MIFSKSKFCVMGWDKMENIKARILDYREVKKNNKEYHIVTLWLNFSEVTFSVFVSKDTYNNIISGIINSDNITNYLHFRVGSDEKFLVSIY